MLNRSIKKALLNKARRMAPVDTWNLRLNAMKGKNWNDPLNFTIAYDTADAYYIEYLEDYEMAGGSDTKRNIHKGFIRQTTLELQKDLDNYFNKGGRKPTRARFNKKQYGVWDYERNIRHNKSLDYYKMRRGD